MALNSGDEAWLLMSSALVQLMTPGVALLYSGMVGSDKTLHTIMMSLGAMGIVTVLWSLVGFSMAFGPHYGPGVIGDGTFATLDNIGPTGPALANVPMGQITTHTYANFQLMFAVITSAIISGSLVGKVKWYYFMLFTAMWHLLIYCPLAHWIFYANGWAAQYGIIDFAGGLVIHVASGVSALVVAFWLSFCGDKDLKKIQSHTPHNVPNVVLGIALLWFGWFGFNSGSALSAGYSAGLAFTNTQMAPATAMLTWNALEVLLGGGKLMGGRPTAVGACMGILAGLVGVTPAAGFVSPMWALFIGFFTSLVVYFAVKAVKIYLRVDDSLDTFAVHGVGGAVGSALTGLFANYSYGQATDFTGAPAIGSFYGNRISLAKECAGISVTVLFASVGTTVIFWTLWVLAKSQGDTLQISSQDREYGADISQHGETAYYANSRTMDIRAPTSTAAATTTAATTSSSSSSSSPKLTTVAEENKV